MTTIDRPSPVGTDKRGQPVFDPEELALYREARGVDQVRLAISIGVSQPLIAQYETGKRKLTFGSATRLMDHVDRIADRRDKRESDGRVRLGLLRTFCRVDVTRGTRLERCGNPTEPGLVVCIEHIEKHEELVGPTMRAWARKTRQAEKRAAARKASR